MKKITLRLPDDLHQELLLIADQEERSLNSQILYFLRHATEGERHAESATADSREAAYHHDCQL